MGKPGIKRHAPRLKVQGLGPILFKDIAISGYALLDQVEKGLAARRPVALRILRNELLCERDCLRPRLFRLLRLFFRFVDLDEGSAARGRVVESFGCRRGLRIDRKSTRLNSSHLGISY